MWGNFLFFFFQTWRCDLFMGYEVSFVDGDWHFENEIE